MLKTTQVFITDCDAPCACHAIEMAINITFKGSEIEGTSHDPSAFSCISQGNAIINETPCYLWIKSYSKNELSITIEMGVDVSQEIFEAIVTAYESFEDAGGNRHKLVILEDNPID